MSEYLTLSHGVAALLGALALVGLVYLSDLLDNRPPMSDSEPRRPAGD